MNETAPSIRYLWTNLIVRTCVNANILLAENCNTSHPGCTTIWNTDVPRLYHDLIAGTLSSNQLQSFCRFWFLPY